MTNRLFLIALIFLSQTVAGQHFPGYSTGNYTGVNGVFSNPANIADSRYRWDFNLFSINTGLGNNQASFNLKDISNSFETDSLTERFIGSGAGMSSGMMTANIHGPSLMFNLGEKSSIALTSRARVMMNAVDIDGKLVDRILESTENDPELPYTIQSSANMRASINAWSEFGASYAQVLHQEGAHFVKGGLTLKYLAGVANGYVNIDRLNATLNEDAVSNNAYLEQATGRLELGLGGVDISDFDADKLTSFRSTGFGGDIGFVYEYRPDHEQYRLKDGGQRRDLNKYKFRFGIALLDVGAIKYERDQQRSGGYELAIEGAERFYLDELEGVEIDSLKAFFDGHPTFFTPTAANGNGDYKVGLPTTLRLDADYHFSGGFYLNLAGQISLSNTEKKPYTSQYYSGFTVTPRFEGRAFGLYVPAGYNGLTGFNAGVSLRMGPLFIGSGSALTALLGESKQADVHIGLRFGGLQKNKAKKTAENNP